MHPTSLCAFTVHLSQQDVSEKVECSFTHLSQWVSLACLGNSWRAVRVDVPAGLTHLTFGGRLQAVSVPQSLRDAEVKDPALCLGFMEAFSSTDWLDYVWFDDLRYLA